MSNPVMVTRRLASSDESVIAHLYHHLIWCPGCNDLHAPRSVIPGQAHREGDGPTWEWDGNETAPTFAPSLLVYGSADNGGNCHSFIRGGRWEFLPDSAHHLAGQTVPMVSVPDWVADKTPRPR